MVVAFVLCRSRLTAGHEVILRQLMAGTAECRGAHALHHIVIGLTRRLRIVFARIGRIERFSLHLLHYVGHIVVATVGNRRTKVRYLQRCGVHLTLSDGDTDDRQSVPGALIGLVVKLCIGNHATLLAWQVDA